MKRLLWAVVAVLASSASAWAQDVPWANRFFTYPESPPPVVSHDFGTVPRGTVLKHQFPVTNIYRWPMRIGQIRTSCGCVIATASNTVLGVNSDDKIGSIEVVMDGRKFSGEKEVTLYVPFSGSDPNGKQFFSTALLRVKAFGRGDVMVTPGQIDFGVIAQTRNQPATQTAEIVSMKSGWRLTGIVQTEAPFDVQVQPMGTPNGQVSYRVSVTLKQDARAGTINDEVVLQTNDSTSPQLRIRVSGLIQAPLLVTPSAVNFGTVQAGETRTTNVLVRGNRAFRLLRVEGAGDGLSVQLPSHAAQAMPVPISFRPTTPGKVQREIRIMTDLDGGSVVTVKVDAMVN